jgi:ABC-2 type transport system permease protein
MTGLFLAELRRYRSRRAVHVAGMIVVAVIALAGFLVFINSSDAAPFLFTSLTDTLTELSLLLVIFALGLGATFIGAEWSAGTVTTLLTWEPRRGRVMVAKIVAAGVFVFVAAVAIQVLMGLAMLPAAMVRGSMEGVDASWFTDTADIALRSSTIAAIAAPIGFAIAAIARNTGAAIIVGFIYFTVLEGLIRALRPNWARWLFGENAALFMFGREVGGLPLHSQTRAIATLLAYAAILAIIATSLFRRRDVT